MIFRPLGPRIPVQQLNPTKITKNKHTKREIRRKLTWTIAGKSKSLCSIGNTSDSFMISWLIFPACHLSFRGQKKHHRPPGLEIIQVLRPILISGDQHELRGVNFDTKHDYYC